MLAFESTARETYARFRKGDPPNTVPPYWHRHDELVWDDCTLSSRVGRSRSRRVPQIETQSRRR